MSERRFSRVAVLMGGGSSEHGVSLESGEAAVSALLEAGYDVVPVRMPDRMLSLPEGTDAVFIALHGGFGENGELQAELDALRIPYTGPGSKACSLAMDKELFLDVVSSQGVPVPEGCVIDSTGKPPFPFPLVVKPPLEGSSVGVHIVKDASGWDCALADTCGYGGKALVERFIPGREFTVGVLDGRALPVIEIVVSDGWYDFDSKYRSGDTRYCFPDEPVLCRRCQRISERVFAIIGARGVSRVDFRVSPEGEPFVLELNAIPGFTAKSLVPKAAAHKGMSFADLCASLVEMACFDGE